MITSIKNPKIQNVRILLARRKERKEAQAFVLEGVRLVEEAFIARWRPLIILYSKHLSKRGEQVLQHFAAQDVEIEEVSQEIMLSLSETDTPQGLLAVFNETRLPIPEKMDNILIVDGVRDPGNLGTVLRTALAGGVQAVLLTPGCVDAFSPKVLRAAMGAHFRLPIHTMEWDEIHNLIKIKSKPDIKMYLTVANAGKPCWEMDFRSPLALVIGGEAEGVSHQLQKWADGFVNIPMPGGSESLNVAIAAGIIIFEIVRQRSQ